MAWKKYSNLSLLGFVFVNAFSSNGVAALNREAPRGEKVVSLRSSQGANEICVLPQHFPGAPYTENDIKRENKLCEMVSSENVAVCEKINSTNPGLNFYDLPDGMSAAQVEAKDCEVAGAKKKAKYKLSTSCSYTPSLLSYYHVSRILGGVGKVPPAVVRTFDLKRHVEIGRQALNRTARGSLISQTWSGLFSQLKSPASSSKKAHLFTTDLTQSYGALQWNPSDEAFYREFFAGGSDALARAVAFRDRSPVMKLLKSPQILREMVGSALNTQNLQKAVAMKDASEMIILDTLLNQQDRFGNIHFVLSAYRFDPSDLNEDGVPNLKSEENPTAEEAQGAVVVKRMVMKDNDCGVAKANIAKQAGLSQSLRHLDPKTYRKLLKLESVIEEASTQKFFMDELLMTSADFLSFKKNVKELVSKFRESCRAGNLHLDLDLDAHFSNRPIKVSCEL